MTAPTRAEVRSWLRQLADGDISRRDAADRASPWIAEREREVTDSALWRPLAQLAGADIETAPSEFLYDTWDFDAWLNEFELAVEIAEPPPA